MKWWMDQFENDSPRLKELSMGRNAELILRVSIAYHFAVTQYPMELNEYFQNFDKPISIDKIDQLRKMGIEHDCE